MKTRKFIQSWMLYHPYEQNIDIEAAGLVYWPAVGSTHG
jgi:hypothetical protein